TAAPPANRLPRQPLRCRHHDPRRTTRYRRPASSGRPQTINIRSKPVSYVHISGPQEYRPEPQTPDYANHRSQKSQGRNGDRDDPRCTEDQAQVIQWLGEVSRPQSSPTHQERPPAIREDPTTDQADAIG